MLKQVQHDGAFVWGNAMSRTASDDFTEFTQLAASGTPAIEAARHSASQGNDFFFQIRILRAVYDCDLITAREIAAKATYQ